MANLKPAKTEEEVKKLGVANVRIEYNKLAADYNRIVDRDVLMCPMCGDFIKADTGFYMDKKYATDRFPICKQCLLAMVEQRKNKNDKSEPNETKESVQRVLQLMDRIYDDEFYNNCVKGAADEVNEKLRHSAFATYITSILSLPQWKGKTWKDSDFGDAAMSADDEEIKIIQKTVKAGKKRFGNSYSNEELMFLENEYQDWITRYECNNKAQEEVFENLSLIKLLKKKAIMRGESIKDLDKQQQDWLETGKLKPKQNTSDTLSDAQTFGTLLQKWEETRPLPDIDPELEDVDKIGLYIETFFKGHTAKMLGIKNTFTNLYERVMQKYTVNKPQYDDEEDSEMIFEKIFGSNTEDA